jgi:predicted RecB family nuclease
VALVYGVDQGLAVELHNREVASIGQLLERFDARSLSELKRPSGKAMKRVGNGAGMILRRAQVMVSGQDVLLSPPSIPTSDHYVMFDLEGMPPHLDELDKIYLWGMQVFGVTQGEFMPAVAGFGEEGDRAGWNEFLTKSGAIIRQFGDIPFVHWHLYEKTHITKYITRYGDPQGVAGRVLANLLDLHPIALKCILLPLPSYSLKVVEKYVGFQRTQDEYGGSWSMAKYIEATETQDVQLRQQLLDQILLYNKEDLAATWAVFEWLRHKITT